MATRLSRRADGGRVCRLTKGEGRRGPLFPACGARRRSVAYVTGPCFRCIQLRVCRQTSPRPRRRRHAASLSRRGRPPVARVPPTDRLRSGPRNESSAMRIRGGDEREGLRAMNRVHWGARSKRMTAGRRSAWLHNARPDQSALRPAVLLRRSGAPGRRLPDETQERVASART